MPDQNTVEIRFHIVEDKDVGEKRLQDLTQSERDQESKLQKLQETHSKFERMEHRLEHRIKHMAARMIGAGAAQEIGGMLGTQNSFLGRMGESAIEGSIMGGAPGAAFRMSLTLIHGLIDTVKNQGEEIRRIREEQRKKDEEDFKRFLDFAHDINEQAQRQRDELEEEKSRFAREYKDYMMNAERWVALPYAGARS